MRTIGFALFFDRGCNNGPLDQAHHDFLLQKGSAWRRNGRFTQSEHVLHLALS